MGRYSDYMRDIWAIQANRKVLGITLFGVFFDNSKPFTPGDQLQLAEGAETAVQILSQKGYDLLIISGQPSKKTKNLSIQDFENILSATREGVERLGGRVKNAYYAPGIDKNDPYVKPNAGMFEKAQNEGMVDWSKSYFVGFEANDIKAAVKVKALPVLIKPANSEVNVKALALTHQLKIQEFPSLLEFAQSL